MKAAWDWHHPRTSEQDEVNLVTYVSDLGFDALVINGPTEHLLDAARRRGIRLIAVLSPHADDEFRRLNPGCIQAMLPFEERHLENLRACKSEQYERIAHRWVPYLQEGNLLCYDQEKTCEYLRSRTDVLLRFADGIALDGFGYKNHYACFCEHCGKRHGTDDPEAIALASVETLISCSKTIFDYVKSIDPANIVMNHIWPPFEPDPYYGAELYLDYCSQTISWFYRPHWSLDRVEFEAAEHRRLQKSGRNRFVPFIGYVNDRYHRRTPERLAREIAIGLEYGDGDIVFSTLQGPMEDPEIEGVIRRGLS